MTDQPTAPQTWDTLPDDPADIPFPIVVGWEARKIGQANWTAMADSIEALGTWTRYHGDPDWWMPWPTFQSDPTTVDHRLAADVGGHPVIPLPVRWRMGAHGDPIAEFDYIVLHLHRDGSVTWHDELAAAQMATTDANTAAAEAARGEG